LLNRLVAFLSVAILAALGAPSISHAAVSEPAFSAINAEALWDRGYFGEGASIAFIDQGVNLNHEYFQGEVIDGFCLYSSESINLCPNRTKSQTGAEAASQRIQNRRLVAAENHGNMVAGIAAGKPNARAPGGVAPQAKIVMANIDLTLEGITKATQYILDNAEKNNTAALSLSFGGLFREIPRSWLQCDQNPGLGELAGLFKQLRDKGVITFASAGNTPTLDVATSVFPSCLQEVVAVGSVNQRNEISWYVTMSQKIELLAPDYALSADTTGYQISSGTSAAAPLVAGAFTLLRTAFPAASSEEILEAMKVTGVPVDDVLRKDIPVVDLAAAYRQLSSATIPAAPVLKAPVEQKVSIGVFDGYVAIYTKGYEGKRLSIKIGGSWAVIDSIETSPGKPYSLTKRKVGPNQRIAVEVYIDRKLVAKSSVLTR